MGYSSLAKMPREVPAMIGDPPIHNKEMDSTDADVSQDTKMVPFFSQQSIIPRTMERLRRDYGLICPISITLG